MRKRSPRSSLGCGDGAMGDGAMTAASNSSDQTLELRRVANRLRRQVVRMVARLGQGYVQQGLGAADLFTSLFFSELRLDPARPDWPDRDRFLLSTAHNSALFHATLAERGFLTPAQLDSYCNDGSALEVNVSERLGSMVEATCGSLGQGPSVGLGMALSGRRRQRRYRVYVLLGDGELQEGQVWEAFMAAAGYGVDNLCLIVDLNDMQVEGRTDSAMPLGDVAAKLAAFGWATEEIDGHDFPSILGAFDRARETRGRPSAIVPVLVHSRIATSSSATMWWNSDLICSKDSR